MTPSDAVVAPGRVRSTKMSVAVAKQLLDYITGQGLQAGDTLPNERDMLASLGVARGSLREALRLLESQGIITIRSGPGGGPVVGEADPEIFAGMTTMLMQFMGVTYGEVIDARIAFEPHVAAVAARLRSAEQAAALQDAVAEMAAAVQDRAAFELPYNTFHDVLGSAAGNQVLLMSNTTFRKIWERVHPEIRSRQEGYEATVRAHARIADAIVAGDAEAARTASLAHLTDYRDWVAINQPELLSRPVDWVVGS